VPSSTPSLHACARKDTLNKPTSVTAGVFVMSLMDFRFVCGGLSFIGMGGFYTANGTPTRTVHRHNHTSTYACATRRYFDAWN
jgi:hypothetical protein